MMRTASVLCISAGFLCLCPVALSQTALDKARTQDILSQLTSQSYTTWISAGTIEATHQEYGQPKVTDEATIKSEINDAIRQYQENTNKVELTAEEQKKALDAIPFNVRYRLANEYSMTSRHTVKYDGSRFYWEINVSSRSDSVKPDAALAENASTEEFKMASNQRRVFSWDGQKYTVYSASGGQAIVDASARLGTPVVNGPLTAGLIPWGAGRFSSENLATASVSASSPTTTAKDSSSVRMSITHADGATSDLVLDSTKAYAVTSATLTHANGMVANYTLSGYKSVGGRWVPSSVAIERKNVPVGSAVPTSEQWTFTSVGATKPSLSSFNVDVAMDHTIEYFAPTAASSAIYINSYETDTDELLAERLAYEAAGSRSQNCATAALRRVATTFGKPVSNAALANLVGADGFTSMHAMKQFAQGLGLYSQVVKTDLAGLENLGTAKAILHIPGKNHFVLVDRVDGQYVWLIDPSNRNFYHRQSVHFFPLEWTEGTALLVSDRPISSQFPAIPDSAAQRLTGGVFYACNVKAQNVRVYECDFVGGVCQGYYTVYQDRWYCGQAESGTCSYGWYVKMVASPCVPDPYVECTYTGEWEFYDAPYCG